VGKESEKVCRIVNGRFSYQLIVDGEKIAFNYSWNAEYFARHYKALGYKVVKEGDGE